MQSFFSIRKVNYSIWKNEMVIWKGLRQFTKSETDTENEWSFESQKDDSAQMQIVHKVVTSVFHCELWLTSPIWYSNLSWSARSTSSSNAHVLLSGEQRFLLEGPIFKISWKCCWILSIGQSLDSVAELVNFIFQFRFFKSL